MSFGLSATGFSIKRLEDVKDEIEQEFKNQFGDNIDLDPGTAQGQMIGIFAEREALLWELLQNVYDSQYPASSEGKNLDNVSSITGTVRESAKFSRVVDGVARGDNGTIVPAGTIISVSGNSDARFVTQDDATINIVDGGTFKTGPILLVAEESGPVQANTGFLTEIETPVSGMDSFINESDAILGEDEDTDAELRQRRNEELQLSGACTQEAIRSELLERPLVEAALVFVNRFSIPDIDGRPPKSVDIVVKGDDEQDLADEIFNVVAAGEETIGDISKTVFDSQGFSHIIKFSRPTDIDIWLEIDFIKDPTLFPADGETQMEDAILAYGASLGIGEDIIVFGTKALSCVFDSIPGILDLVIRVGKAASPTLDDNVILAAREIAGFDSARIDLTDITP